MAAALERSITSHPATRLSILLTIRDHAQHHSLMVKLVQRARGAGLAGGTVFEAQQGYGASGRLHRRHLISEDAPVVIVIVDHPDRIGSFLDSVEDLLEGVVFMIDDVEVIEV